MTSELYTNGVLRERWDHTSRTVTFYNAQGAQTSTRPYTTAENAAADAQAAAETAQAVEAAHQTAQRALVDATLALTAQAHTDGQPWVQPSGAHDAYALGATVTHGGKTWTSLTPFNVWAPGVSGWREEVAEGYPAWVQPTGAHDAYNIGDRVAFEGQHYESIINGNAFSPAVYPAGWQTL